MSLPHFGLAVLLSVSMTHLGNTLVCSAAASDGPAGANTSVGQHKPGVAWYEPYTYKTRDGRTISEAERGRFLVPEDPARRSSPLIELSFIRFKSKAKEPGPPIVWLAGGPSDYGSDDIEGPYLALVREFQEVGDVIAFDQRGTGLSRPRLDCPDSVVQLPLNRVVEREEYLEAYRRVATACNAHWRRQNVDLSAYNTLQNAEDVDLLRKALGAKKIILYGGSYGTHLGLTYLRRHSDHAHSAIFSGVEGPAQTWKLPRNVDAHFEEVARLARADSTLDGRVPDLIGLMRSVRDGLRREPATVLLPSADSTRTDSVVVGSFDLEMANLYFLGSRSNIAQLPSIYVAMSRGDYSDLAGITRQFREVGAGSAMYFAMDCASGASVARVEERREQARTSLVGTALDFPFPEICDCWTHKDLGESFRSPVQSSVPTLFISGTLDGQTPVRNADEVKAGFSRATQLIVDGASHTYTELDPEEIRRFMIAFLRNPDAPDTRISVPLLKFAPIPAAANRP